MSVFGNDLLTATDPNSHPTTASKLRPYPQRKRTYSPSCVSLCNAIPCRDAFLYTQPNQPALRHSFTHTHTYAEVLFVGRISQAINKFRFLFRLSFPCVCCVPFAGPGFNYPFGTNCTEWRTYVCVLVKSLTKPTRECHRYFKDVYFEK